MKSRHQTATLAMESRIQGSKLDRQAMRIRDKDSHTCHGTDVHTTQEQPASQEVLKKKKQTC